MSDNARSRPVLTGQVPVEGATLVPIVAHPSEIFYRQLSSREFDASEMSISSLAIVRDAGVDDLVALPIFPVRRFFHAGILVRSDAGIDTPEQLRGKRVGVPEYQQTAAVWSRGFLADEAGVQPADMEWFMERPLPKSHSHAVGNTLPTEIRLSTIPPGESIASMLSTGSLDAALHYIPVVTPLDRSGRPAEALAGVRRLFPDPVAETVRYFGLRHILPMNHCVAIRRDVHEKYPWLARNLYEAFLAAARIAAADFAETRPLWQTVNGVDGVPVDADPFAYGVAPNRTSLDALFRYVHEQHLTATRFDPLTFFDALPDASDLN